MSERRVANQVLYQEMAQIAAALASPVRLRALNLILQAPKSIDALAEELGESRANTTAHMKALRAVGLVAAERRGKYIDQRPLLPAALQVFFALRDASEALSPALRLLNDEPDEAASPLSLAELEALRGQKRMLLLDLRPPSEFSAGHLPGARSLPFEQLAARCDELPRRHRLLAYGRGRYCQRARQGVITLRSLGLHAERLRFGVPEWLASGRTLAQ